MPTCPACGHENAYGALVCANCYKLLVEYDANTADTTFLRDTKPNTEPTPMHPGGTRLIGDLQPDDVMFRIAGHEQPVIVQVARQIILGRYTANSTTQPRIDLTPYGAVDSGVSRMHAIIRRTDEGLKVEDLASSNGTWLNAARLQPYQPRLLNTGDTLRLSQLEMRIHFGPKVERAGV